MDRRNFLIKGSAAAGGLLATPSIVSAQETITLRIGAGHATPALAYVYAHDTYFIEEVTKRAEEAGIKVRFITAWAGTVAKVDGIMESVESGILDLGLAAPGFEASRIGILNWASVMPFGSTDANLQTDVANRILREVPEIQEVFARQNTVCLAAHVGENYGHPLVNPVERPEDLAGRKMSIAPVSAHWLSSMGAVPTPLGIGAVYQAVQTGLIEGSTFWLSGMLSLRLNEVYNYFYDTEYGITPNIALVMNKQKRDQLPPELVAIIDTVAQETGHVTAQVGHDREVEAIAALEGEMPIIKITAEDKLRWSEAMLPDVQRIVQDIDASGQPGTPVYNAYIQYMKEGGHEWPLEFSLS